MALPEFLTDEQVAELEGSSASPSASLPDFISDSEMESLSTSAPSEGSTLSSLLIPIAATARATDSALLGVPSKLSAGLEALTGEALQAVNLIPPRSFSDTYSAALQDYEGKTVNELGEIGAIAADVGGGFISPINKIKAVQDLNKLKGLKGILGRTALASGVAGVDSALDGENALKSAARGGGANLAIEAVATPAVKLVGKVGKEMFNKGVGLTARDYAAAAKEMDLGKLGQGKKRLLGALDQVKPKGLKGYLSAAGSTEDFLTNLANKAEEVSGGYGNQATRIIAQAEKVAPGLQIDPDLDLMASGAERLGAYEEGKVLSNLMSRWSAFADKYKGKGGSTLTNLQKEKVGMNRLLSEKPAEVEAATLWRRGVRSALEKTADARVGQPGTSYKAGDLKEANLQYGALQSLKSSLQKDLPTAQASDLGQTIRQGLYTTSGVGSQGIKNISEASRGGAIAASIMSLANYLQPVGRVMGMGLEDAASVIEKSLPGFRLGIAAALQDEDITPEDQTLLQEDTAQSSLTNDGSSKLDKTASNTRSKVKSESAQGEDIPSLQPTATENATQDQFSGLLGLDDTTSSNNSIFSLKNASLFDVGGGMDQAPQAEVRGVEDMKVKQLPAEFEAEVDNIAKDLDTDPTFLKQVMHFETGGTFVPAQKNKAGSGATGLIQFMPSTAKELTGASDKQAAIKILESMSPVEQLQYVKKYLKPFKGKLDSLEDLYMAVLYPKAVGKDSEYALFKEGTKAYWQNRGLDLDKDGVITKAEATSKVKNFWEA